MFAHHHVPHDADRDWGADPAGIDAVIAAIGGETAHAGFDLREPDTPAALLDAARAAFGHVDILVCNHASSGPDGPLADVTAEMLDAPLDGQHARVAAARPGVRPPPRRAPGRADRVHDLGPEPRADAGRSPTRRPRARSRRSPLSIADELADRGITVNCVNPGPDDTGWANPALTAAVAAQMPAGRWGEPDDAARLIAWLVSEEGRWITGQVLNSEGGFRR